MTNRVDANAKTIKTLMETNEALKKSTQAKLDHCDTDLACIRKDLTNFNQINKDFLGVVRTKMAHFDDTINEANEKLDAKIKEHCSEKKNSDWALKMEVEERLEKFEVTVETTNTKVIIFLFSSFIDLEFTPSSIAITITLI